MRARTLGLASFAVAATASCYDPNTVTAPDDVFVLTATPTTIAANGFTTSEIRAHVDPKTARVFKIFFKTVGGTLPTGAADGRGPDTNGDVTILLTSDPTPKTAVVTADVKEGDTIVASRSVSVTFEAVAPTSVIRLIATPSTQLDADGASSLTLRAEVNPGLAVKTVTFKTSDGTFERGKSVTELRDVATGADGVAHAQLYAPKTIGSALVTALAGNFSATQTITFAAAAPSHITLEADPLQQSRAMEDNVIRLTAHLSRATGAVTTGTRVDFSIANDASGMSFGRFQSVKPSNTDEQATAQFVPGVAAPLGLATITARVLDTNLTASIKVDIVN
jgi:hypothetical protein